VTLTLPPPPTPAQWTLYRSSKVLWSSDWLTPEDRPRTLAEAWARYYPGRPLALQQVQGDYAFDALDQIHFIFGNDHLIATWEDGTVELLAVRNLYRLIFRSGSPYPLTFHEVSDFLAWRNCLLEYGDQAWDLEKLERPTKTQTVVTQIYSHGGV